jgi:hypothetical protein
VQADINIVADWSKEYDMPLSIEKTVVLHSGRRQPLHAYELLGLPLTSVSSFKDLGVNRSSDGGYAGHCAALVAKSSKMAGAISRVFRTSSRDLLWPAFQTYVLPAIMYCSPAWNPSLRYEIDAIESVQRRFTKRLHGMRQMSYNDRLNKLEALSLSNRRIYADMIFTYKAIHGLVNCSASDFGLSLVSSITRGHGVLLKQLRATTRSCATLFACRGPSVWNKLPINITSSRSLSIFKTHLYRHLLTTQS